MNVLVAILGTDWGATLFGGLVGAILGTFGAFSAAFYVVRAQRRADQEQRQADRRQAELDRRLDLVNRGIDTLTEMRARFFVHTGDLNDSVGHMKALDYVSGHWQRLDAVAMQLDIEELGSDARELGHKALREGGENPPELLEMVDQCWTIVDKAFNELLVYSQLVLEGKRPLSQSSA